jgi:hypothetical protein
MSATTLDLIRPGRRAVAAEPVDRFHLGVAVDRGMAGEIIYADREVVAWRPDCHVGTDLLDEWDGAFEWYALDDAYGRGVPESEGDARRAFIGWMRAIA